MFSKYRWVLLFVCAVVTAAAGLYLGKLREKDYLGAMYARQDFTLLDDQGGFFRLSKFPANKLLLLVFSPDALEPQEVKLFRAFAGHLGELKNLDVETVMVSRVNREIVDNFKAAAGFSFPVLLDPSGTVGKLTGIWPNALPVRHWGYALIDQKLRVYWRKTHAGPLAYADLLAELQKLSASMKTSSESR